ncbi:uncharacterized protein LOC128802709 [Vidua macroura]|uniref:uncharacterized protein LOC128802709 n=1 Tax=Vidua macroura TaxID=187451 RepID=UPI0023A7B902|nr:uncharacterized protein LOC128802709 [Vidua macroura]
MALEGQGTMTATSESHLNDQNVLRGTISNNRTGQAAETGSGTIEATTQSPTTPSPVASTSGTSPASGTTEARPSPTLGSSMETPTPGHPSTALPTGQPKVQGTATSPPTGSPSPSTATASAGSSATTPHGDEESSTTTQGDITTTQPTANTTHSLPSTPLMSTMKVTGGEGRTDTTTMAITSGGGSLRTSRSGAVSPAFPTTGTGTTTGPESGTASSPSFGSAVTSHSSSSSPEGSSPVTASPQQSGTSSTTEMLLATTSHPSASLVFSTAGVTDTGSDTVTAEEVTPSPAPSTASTNPVSSASIPSPASETTAPSRSPAPGSSTETPAPGHPSTALASAGSNVTTPPGEGESSTMNQEDRTTEPTANTAHSLPSTSTTNLSVPTSANPSSTCLTVSIKVQNVTAEEIQLSWTSSSKSSFYNISVKDGGKEIRTATTNETKAVFQNLLPGHVYDISVSVSSCAENNPASVTVRTDSGSCFKRTELCLAQSTGCSDLKSIVCSNNQAFACRVWLKNETFNNTLYNSDSESYITMAERFKTEVVAAMHAELGNNHSDVFVLGFRPGSVIVDFLFLLPKEKAMDVDYIQTHLSNVLRSKYGSQSEVQTLSVQSSTDNSSSWRVAVIVLGVLLGVALVLILLAIVFYIHVRRRSGMDFSTLYTW